MCVYSLLRSFIFAFVFVTNISNNTEPLKRKKKQTLFSSLLMVTLLKEPQRWNRHTLRNLFCILLMLKFPFSLLSDSMYENSDSYTLVTLAFYRKLDVKFSPCDICVHFVMKRNIHFAQNVILARSPVWFYTSQR